MAFEGRHQHKHWLKPLTERQMIATDKERSGNAEQDGRPAFTVKRAILYNRKLQPSNERTEAALGRSETQTPGAERKTAEALACGAAVEL